MKPVELAAAASHALPDRSLPMRFVRAVALVVAALIAIVVVAGAVLLATALHALRAAPGDWAVRTAIGPLDVSLSMPSLLRVATHPLGIRLLDGRRIATRHGLLHVRAGATPTTLVVRCAPCVVDSRQIASRPVRLAEVEATIEPGGINQLKGTLRADRVRAGWHGKLGARSAELELELADVPAADLVALLGPAVPESAQARIEGRAGARVRLALPTGRVAIEPRLDGLAVEGLGTEALIAARPLPACARPPRGRRAAAPFGTWLAKAVIAAEDQRFHEHPGYDLAEMAAAWSTEPPEAAGKRRGASTLSQQLAKLLYVGDERTVARKVRELLYAVELDRTLGKARVLQLYLSIVPWGDGQCGAEAAALHYFGKRAASLDGAEAVWLASLLRHPEAELERAAQAFDPARLQAIAGAIRPLPRWRREDLQHELGQWHPPPVVHARHGPRAAPS